MGGAWGRPTGTPDQHPRAQLPLFPRPPGTLIRWRTELGLWRQRSGAGSTLDDLKERGHPAIPTLPRLQRKCGHSSDPSHNFLSPLQLSPPSPPHQYTPATKGLMLGNQLLISVHQAKYFESHLWIHECHAHTPICSLSPLPDFKGPGVPDYSPRMPGIPASKDSNLPAPSPPALD